MLTRGRKDEVEQAVEEGGSDNRTFVPFQLLKRRTRNQAFCVFLFTINPHMKSNHSMAVSSYFSTTN
jgi:hypothetical protein